MTDQNAKKVFRLLRKISSLMGESGGNSLKLIGRRWEKRFSRLAKDAGCSVSDAPGKSLSYDLIVNGLRVQCKKRKPLRRGEVRLCFTVRATRGAAREAYMVDDFDVLALRCDRQTYIIPANELASKDGITLANVIKPRQYTQFVDNWGAFFGSGASRHETQRLLFGGVAKS